MTDEVAAAIIKTPPLSEMCLEDERCCVGCDGSIAADAMVISQPGRVWHEACWDGVA